MAINKKAEHEKLIKINIGVILIGGLGYSVLYFLSGDFAMALGIISVTVVMTVLARLLQKKANEDVVIYFLTSVQYAAVALFGLLGGEFAGGFPLIISVVAMNTIYFKKVIVVIQWVVTDVIILGSLFFMDALYGNIGTSFLLRGIIGVNFCMLFLYILLVWILKFKSEALEKATTSKKLLEQIEEQMREQKERAKTIQSVFDGIKENSDNLKITSEQMLSVSGNLSSNASNQTEIITELAQKSAEISDEIKSAKDIVYESSNMVKNSARIIKDSNNEMVQAVLSIEEMEESNKKIIHIIGQIEEIAFQTNILALNAAIEAARAGVHGKGFAVVAEEVQTLAAKSSEAANATNVLVTNSISNVKQGAKLIKNAAKNMQTVIEESNLTVNKVEDINVIIEEQVKTVEEMMSQINSFMDVITQTSQTAVQSNSMANDISEQIAHINSAIKSGK